MTVEKSTVGRVTVKLDPSDHKRLRALATTRKRTPHYLMKEAIHAYIEQAEVEQAVLEIVDDSAAHFEATGLHITFNEVKDWAKRLKTDRNAKLPECHI